MIIIYVCIHNDESISYQERQALVFIGGIVTHVYAFSSTESCHERAGNVQRYPELRALPTRNREKIKSETLRTLRTPVEVQLHKLQKLICVY